MNFEFDDQSLQDSASEACDGSQKFSKVSYTREFLLSLSELEICKNLPSGFDRSILGEFEDTTQQRIPGLGSSPVLGFRRGDYSSSPPARGDSSNYSRGIYGKWGSRASGQSDKDSESQSDRDSESSRRQGNPLRRSWQSTDHDGLLGSGSFPRPSGYAAGAVASKVRGDDHFQLKKSSEPYHPPRPYKAVPHTRREFNDSLNDETFGSTDCTSEDRAEEEKKRRASFELMRKEQQKVLQEKQKMHVDKQKDAFFTADSASLEQTAGVRAMERDGKLDGIGSQLLTTADSSNNAFSAQGSAPRPLVPPGFAGTVLEKNSAPKAASTLDKEELEGKFLHAKVKPLKNAIFNKKEEIQSTQGLVMTEKQLKDDGIRGSFAIKGEMMVNPLSGLDITNQFYGSSSIIKASEALVDGETVQLNTKKLTVKDTLSDSNQDKSVSILDKLFGSSLSANTPEDLKEPFDAKPDDKQSPSLIQSSKFSHWFLEDEKKSPEHLTSAGPDHLLSLIVGGEKVGTQASDVEAMQVISPELAHQGSELTNLLASSSMSSATSGISEQPHKYNNVEAVPAVLTCEDLEEKILSEYSENNLMLQPPVYNSAADGEMVQSKASVDNHASLHLLSLLQKGTNLKDMTPSPSVEIGLSDQLPTPEVSTTGTTIDKSREPDGPLRSSGKNITLESLFGTAFMKELQSVEAPISVHRSVAGPARADYIEPHGLSFHAGNDGSRPVTVDNIESKHLNFENGILSSNSEQQTKHGNVENWLGFADPQINLESLKLQNEGRAKHGLHGLVQSKLPEEDSLLIHDPLNPSKSRYIPAKNMNSTEVLSNTSMDIADKLAALNGGYKDERSLRVQEGLYSNRGPYNMNESERQFHNLHANASPPQFHYAQMSHGRPLFHPIDSHSAHMSSQMKFVAPEGINHDGRINNQFPANMIRPPFHHLNTTPGFDLPVHHQMLQQMQVPKNFPPPNAVHEYPRGGQLPHHPSNQQNAFMPEPNMMQGFPFGQRQPNVSSLGMQLPASDVSGGSNPPDALQRLISMEHGANLKQMQTFGINSQGIYNHELDMSSRYR